MKLYKAIENITQESKQDTKNQLKNFTLNKQSMKLYLKLKKKGKTHRSILDRNKADIQTIE